MTTRKPTVGARGFVLAVSGVLALVACTTDYQMGREDQNYGAPNALAGQKQPGPSSATTVGEDGTTNESRPVCVTSGGTLLPEGAPCAVSFKNDILAAFKASGCNIAGSCHGGASPPNQPRIEPDDPGMWNEFAAFKLSNGTAYINPCSQDKATSGIACNVNKTAPCGVLMPPGAGLAADVVTKIETWLACGSPNN